MSMIESLRDDITKIERQIERIQEGCSHPPDCVTKEHHGSTGNYDPTQDCYWTTFSCSLCEKNWSEEGSK